MLNFTNRMRFILAIVALWAFSASTVAAQPRLRSQRLDRLAGLGISMTLDDQNRPHIAYSSYLEDLRYVAWDGSRWPRSTLVAPDLSTRFWHTSIDVDAAGTPHLSYHTLAGDLAYATRRDGQWHNEIVAALPLLEDIFDLSQVLVDDGDRVRIVANETNFVTIYERLAQDQWSFEPLLDTQFSQYSSSLLNTQQATPTVQMAYSDQTDLWYASDDGRTLIMDQVTAGSEVPIWVRIRMDRDGNPAIAFFDLRSQTISIARLDEFWQVTPVLGAALSSSLSFDFTTDNRLVLAYHENSADPGTRLVIEQPDGRFSVTTIAPGLKLGFDWDSELLVDDTGRLHLAYHNGDLNYVTIPTLTPDFNSDGQLTVEDIDQLQLAIREGNAPSSLDLNESGTVDQNDLEIMVNVLFGTTAGDANLDGRFNSQDLVAVFQVGYYEDNAVTDATWGTGDWNADGQFGSGDLVTAFIAGGYEAVAPAEPTQLPEPAASCLLMIGTVAFVAARRRPAHGRNTNAQEADPIDARQRPDGPLR